MSYVKISPPVFEQLTNILIAQKSYALQQARHSPKSALGCLGLPDSGSLPNDISIGSAIFAGLWLWQTDWQTDQQTTLLGL